MRSLFPTSLWFFVATGVVYALQTIPMIGIFLMFMLAPFWSIFLVNAGMLGVALEALRGQVPRAWLVLPIGFYAGYWAVAANDHAKLHALGAAYDAANAKVSVPFDPAGQALVFEKDGIGAWLTQHYALPVAYSANASIAQGYRSERMMDSAVCAKVRQTPALQAASVWAFGFFDGDAIGSRRMEPRFCALSMPEHPDLPMVRVAQMEEKRAEGSLPVTRVTTTITTPDGHQYRLIGGVAAPLSWIPMPVMGCALNSGGPSWNCNAGFWRDGFTPIISGTTRYTRDTFVLARALGLKPVAVADRRGGDPTRILAKLDAVEQDTLDRQVANVEAMISDPLAPVVDWQVGVLANRPEVLDAHADAIMTGVERAAAVPDVSTDRYKARESGRILAGLIARLPRDRFIGFGPRLLGVFAAADDKHWLWEAEPLLRRLGDLGVGALPYLINPRASTNSVNGAGIEGLCRIGPAGRSASEPALLAKWNASRDFDRDARTAMFVAMRRIGISPPPLPEDKRGVFARLQTEWADVSPASPPRVCATRAEAQARREEKYSGKRRTNLD